VKNFIIGTIIAAIIAILDQLSKNYVFAMLMKTENNEMKLLPFFNLVVVHNYGISFGMFNDISYGPLILSAIAIIINTNVTYMDVEGEETLFNYRTGLDNWRCGW